MGKAQQQIDEFFNTAEAVQVEDGTWYYHESSVESELKLLHEQLEKANERVADLEKNQPPIENGKNHYGLDVSYFREVINRELNRSLANHKPDELARVFARLSRTADKSVMFEPEFAKDHDIEQQIKALENAMYVVANQYDGTDFTDWSIGANYVLKLFGKHTSKLRQQINEVNDG